tara:strand:- start:13 stop:501 length:489 start_codon:yes stop_codon:yes gene_type:complete
MVRYISLLLFIGLAWGAELNLDREIRMAKNDRFKNHEISLGMLDDKTGISFIGYTFNIKLNEMNELFVGAGTFLLAFTGTGGIKHYYMKSNLSIYSILSFQAIESMGGNGKLATGSLSFEYNLAKWKYVWAQMKFGGVGVILYAEGNNEFWAYPFAGINFRF